MNKAVIAITQGGIHLASRIKEQVDCNLYVLKKYCNEEEQIPIDTSLTEFMTTIFKNYREIIMIMSCGIAVRSIAPHLRSKLEDPAVIVVDEKGEYVISLLSGHVGGANQLAEQIAQITAGTPIITTASDRLGIEAVDMLAKRLNFFIEDYQSAKEVTACLVNQKKVGCITELSLSSLLPSNLILTDFKSVKEKALDAVIYIGNREGLIQNIEIPVVKLRPKNLVLGIGCKKGVEGQKMIAAVQDVLKRNNLSLHSIKAAATIDLKANEQAILELVEVLSVPLTVIDRKEIIEIEDRFNCSPFVKQNVGVGAVSEPSAYLASKCGKCVVSKKTYEGITISVYEESIDIGGEE